MKLSKHILLSLILAGAATSWGQQIETPAKPPEPTEPATISFNYDDEDLVNVIDYIASKKEINLLYPTRAEEKISGKFSWHLDKKVTIDEAWNLLTTILDVAGYSIVPKENYYEIVKNNNQISHQPMPLYIGMNYKNLPDSDQRIRYLYYLENIKSEGESDNEISAVLKELLPAPADASYKIDRTTNALLIMAKSNEVKSVMSVITQLDRPGFQETMEIVKLTHTDAAMIANLFNNNILNNPNEANRYPLNTQKKSDVTYFSKHVKMIAQERTNSIVILGRAQSVARIKEFIHHYLDVEQDSGKSILHVYQLLYRDARTFKDVLMNIVESKQTEGTEQATTEAKGSIGSQRYFEEVLIAVDTPEEEGAGEEETPAAGEEGAGPIIRTAKYYGGNKLIIAARSDDWKRLKELIAKLDQPEPQVLIEVLIADLTLDDSRQLGTLFRNPAKLPMPGDVNFQSAHLQPGVMPDSFDKPDTVGVIESADGTIQHASDLLRQFFIDPATGQRSDTAPETDVSATTVAQQMPAGSTVLSLSDKEGQTFGITQILKLLDNTKILSHPHVISTNNKAATIEITETRLLRDQATGSQGGTIVATNKNIPASLKVYITPRISISDIRENTVNMQVTIDINEYKSITDNTRITRKVITNATVVTGDVLALGGLIRTNETDTIRETPVLSKIPIIGWLFKKRAKSKQRTNLTVFISPTIIEPRLRSGVGDYTRDYLNLTKEYAKSGELFDSLKDPITRWFFTEESATEKFTKDFMKYDNDNKTPMPHQHTEKSEKKSVLAQAEPNIIMEQQKEQMDQLKDLFQDVDNPFANIEKPKTTA